MMISVLLNVFDTRASLLTLIKLMIEREVSHTGIGAMSLYRMDSLSSQIPRPICSEAIQLALDFYLPSQRSTVTTTCGT
jgi:hypothetical protein